MNPVCYLSNCRIESWFPRALRSEAEKVNVEVNKLRQRCAALPGERKALLEATIAGDVTGEDFTTRMDELDAKRLQLQIDVDGITIYKRKSAMRSAVDAASNAERSRLELLATKRREVLDKQLAGLTVAPAFLEQTKRSDSDLAGIRQAVSDIGEVSRHWLTDAEREWHRSATAKLTAMLTPPQAPQVSGIFK